MTSTELFRVTNHHCEGCGEPPTLPEDFDTGPYWRSYFENKYGEQWICLFNSETNELVFYGGDCGWKHKMHPERIPLEVIAQSIMGGIEGQITLAGKILVPSQLLAKQEPQQIVTFLIDDTGSGIILNEAESIWIDACIAACRAEVPVRDAAWFEEHRAKAAACKKKTR